MKHPIQCLIFLLFSHVGNSASIENPQKPDSLNEKVMPQIHGGIDTYFGYSLNKIENNNMPVFVSSARHNEFNVNLAYLDFSYESSTVRFHLTPGFGTYMQSNYVGVPSALGNLVQANAGIKLFKKQNIWLDAGILGAPFTYEGAKSKDQLLYTRSLGAENSPYYITGVKLGIPLSEKITLSLYGINGWQLIVDNNEPKSFATQLEFVPDEQNTFNWSIYSGNERTEATPDFRNRYFSDVYWTHGGEKLNFSIGGYFGLQEIADNDSYLMNSWWQSNVSLKYSLNKIISLSGRVEYFSDAENTIVSGLNNQTGFDCFSSTLSVAFSLSENGIIRLEGRNFLSKQYLFRDLSDNRINYLNWFTTNLTVWF